MAVESSQNNDFTLVDVTSKPHLYDEYKKLYGAQLGDPDVSIQAALHRQYPELSLTVTAPGNVSLLQFAAAGHASAELDEKDEDVQRLKYYLTGNPAQGIPNQLVDVRSFAKYIYKWDGEYFIVYIISVGIFVFQYILKEPGNGETTMSTNAVTDKLIRAVGEFGYNDKYIYVYDGYWSTSRVLYDEVQKAKWKDVILDENMKRTLIDLIHKFFDSKDIYHDLGVPWKRGIMLHGPAGNGKTISIKAMMHDLSERSGFTIPCLYVKSAPRTYDIGSIFYLARRMAPCFLILEDIDTIVTKNSRSYFFNEVDGLQNNDGIFMVASTNHLDQLDPGIAHRPSRFDRKYLFPFPSLHERVLYCQYWKHKLQDKPSIEFPEELCPAIANITDGFSFAYLKEAFVATLLLIAGRRSDEHNDAVNIEQNLDRYELWREIKRQIKLLRDDMAAGARSRRINDLSEGWNVEDSSQQKLHSPSATNGVEDVKVPQSLQDLQSVQMPLRSKDPSSMDPVRRPMFLDVLDGRRDLVHFL